MQVATGTFGRWDMHGLPWRRAGPVQNRFIGICLDSYSTWPIVLSSISWLACLFCSRPLDFRLPSSFLFLFRDRKRSVVLPPGLTSSRLFSCWLHFFCVSTIQPTGGFGCWRRVSPVSCWHY